MKIETYLQQQAEWSLRTFGAGTRAEGICKHIEKELGEIRKKPYDLVEWADVMILALDGYWRAGGDPQHIMDVLEGKQQINFRRKWPEPSGPDEPTEHVR